MKNFVAPAVKSAPLKVDTNVDAELHSLAEDVRANTMSIHETLEKRMIPTIEKHDKRHPLAL